MEVGLSLGKSLSEIFNLSKSELNLWQAFLMRSKGIPIGNQSAMQKLEAEVKKQKNQDKLKTIKWDN